MAKAAPGVYDAVRANMWAFLDDIGHTYYLWGTVAFCIGSILVLWNMTKNGLAFPIAVITWTAAIYGGLLGTRILFILSTDPRLFVDNLPLALVFWQGRLAWMGGPVLGAAAGFVVLALFRRPIWSNLGSLMPGLALSHALSRVACLAQGCCYGAPTALPWAIYSKKLHTMVHPTPIYSMICELVVVVVLQVLWTRPRWRRYLWPIYGLLLSSHRFVTEAFRGTPPGPELIPGLRFFQAVSILLFLFWACALILFVSRKWGIRVTVLVVSVTAAVLIALRPATPVEAPLEGPQPHYVVVTRAALSGALEPLLAHREAAGFQVTRHVWEETPTVDEVQERLRKANLPENAYVFIVGDAAGPNERERPWQIPAPRRQGHVADLFYGDWDGDGLPDAPVGRWPVRTAGEATRMVTKQLAYERRARSARWFRAVVWSGAERYQDEMRQLTGALVAKAPPWIDPYVINAHPDAAHSGVLAEQAQRFLDAFREPALISLIAAHGTQHAIVPGEKDAPGASLAVVDAGRLRGDSAVGPLFMLACDAGTFALDEAGGPCLAEALIAERGGPVAAVSASMPVHPLTNYFATRALIGRLAERPARLGGLVFPVQRQLTETGMATAAELGAGDPLAQVFLDRLGEKAATQEPGLVAIEASSYSVLGDPATPLFTPEAMEAGQKATGDGGVILSGVAPPGGGQLVVQALPDQAPALSLPAGADAALRREYFEAANRGAPTLTAERVPEGPWRMTVPAVEFGYRVFLLGTASTGFAIVPAEQGGS